MITGGKGSEYNVVKVSGNAIVCPRLNVRESCLVPARKDRKSHLVGRHHHLLMLGYEILLTFSMKP